MIHGNAPVGPDLVRVGGDETLAVEKRLRRRSEIVGDIGGVSGDRAAPEREDAPEELPPIPREIISGELRRGDREPELDGEDAAPPGRIDPLDRERVVPDERAPFLRAERGDAGEVRGIGIPHEFRPSDVEIVRDDGYVAAQIRNGGPEPRDDRRSLAVARDVDEEDRTVGGAVAGEEKQRKRVVVRVPSSPDGRPVLRGEDEIGIRHGLDRLRERGVDGAPAIQRDDIPRFGIARVFSVPAPEVAVPVGDVDRVLAEWQSQEKERRRSVDPPFADIRDIGTIDRIDEQKGQRVAESAIRPADPVPREVVVEPGDVELPHAEVLDQNPRNQIRPGDVARIRAAIAGLGVERIEISVPDAEIERFAEPDVGDLYQIPIFEQIEGREPSEQVRPPQIALKDESRLVGGCPRILRAGVEVLLPGARDDVRNIAITRRFGTHHAVEQLHHPKNMRIRRDPDPGDVRLVVQPRDGKREPHERLLSACRSIGEMKILTAVHSGAFRRVEPHPEVLLPDVRVVAQRTVVQHELQTAAIRGTGGPPSFEKIRELQDSRSIRHICGDERPERDLDRIVKRRSVPGRPQQRPDPGDRRIARVTGDVSVRGPRPPCVQIAPVGARRHEAGLHEKIKTQQGRVVPADDKRKPRNIGGLEPLVPRVQNERKIRRFRKIPAYREQVEILRIIERGKVALPIDAERAGAPTGKKNQKKDAHEHERQRRLPDSH